MLDQIADRLRPVTDGLNTLHQGAKALGEGIVEFFRLLPTALASGAADTMAAHGRDPNAGLALAFDFEAVDPESWEESMRFQKEMHSYFLAVNGIHPTEHQHMGLYLLAQQEQHSFHR